MFSEPSYTNRRVTRQKEELTALIDWYQITVKNIDVFTIIEDILRIPLNLMYLYIMSHFMKYQYIFHVL